MMSEKEEGILLGELKKGFSNQESQHAALNVRVTNIELELKKINNRHLRVAGFASGVGASIVLLFKAIAALFTMKNGG